jgi:hypothetical protein
VHPKGDPLARCLLAFRAWCTQYLGGSVLGGKALSYVDDTEYAARNLIQLVSYEELELVRLKRELTEEEARLRVNRWDFETSDLNDDFSDAYVQGAFLRMARAHQEAERLAARATELQASIGTHQLSVQALSGALLQIAKQGISVVHQNLAQAPDGRHLSGIPLKQIVWQGRNQALHYEEGQFNAAVTQLFNDLEAAYGNIFSLTLHANQSRATQVVRLLEWSMFENFSNDLRMLGL